MRYAFMQLHFGGIERRKDISSSFSGGNCMEGNVLTVNAHQALHFLKEFPVKSSPHELITQQKFIPKEILFTIRFKKGETKAIRALI